VAPGVFLAEAPQTGPSGKPDAARSRSQPRIVGGSTTTIAQRPWQAAVTANPAFFAGNGFQRQFCGGTLVAPSIVVTAAHCTFDIFDSNNAFDAAANFASITGRTTLSNSAQGQEIAWSNLFIFTDGAGNQLYDPNNSRWDVVFAQLASPSPSSNSTPVMIAGANEAAFWAPGNENAVVSGWGTTSPGGSKSDTLKTVDIDMLADSACGNYGPPTSTGGYHPDVMVCAGEVAGGEDTCQGDSGGPLVVPIGGGAFRLVGDTSFGFGCALPTFPGVYGRVAQDPICAALQNGIQSAAGVDVVGPGGCLGAPLPGDATPPDTTITKHPKDKTKKKKAKFEFTSSEPGSTFLCSFDGDPFAACTSPESEKVGKGKHAFDVVAVDPAGNKDATPAEDSWRVKKKKKR